LFDLSGGDEPPPAELVLGDVRDADAVAAAAAGMDGIFHTAALHGIHLQSRSPDDFLTINVLGTRNVLDAAVAHGIGRVVFSSTAGVIGAGAATAPHADGRPRLLDDTPSLPQDIYGLSKVMAEGLCDFYRRCRGVDVVALRYGGVRQLIERATGHLPAEWATSGMLTDLEDAVSSNLLAMAGAVLPRLAYNVLPPTGIAPTRLCVESSAAQHELGLIYRWPVDRFLALT